MSETLARDGAGGGVDGLISAPRHATPNPASFNRKTNLDRKGSACDFILGRQLYGGHERRSDESPQHNIPKFAPRGTSATVEPRVGARLCVRLLGFPIGTAGGATVHAVSHLDHWRQGGTSFLLWSIGQLGSVYACGRVLIMLRSC